MITYRLSYSFRRGEKIGLGTCKSRRKEAIKDDDKARIEKEIARDMPADEVYLAYYTELSRD